MIMCKSFIINKIFVYLQHYWLNTQKFKALDEHGKEEGSVHHSRDVAVFRVD